MHTIEHDIPWHNMKFAWVSCKLEPVNVGHYHLAFRTINSGRALLPQEAKFFDKNGIVKSFTATAGIDSIHPSSGSTEGGTLLTISGNGFYRHSDTTTVRVGGDVCNIVRVLNTLTPFFRRVQISVTNFTP